MSTALSTTSASMLPDAAQLQAMLQFADTLLKSGLLPSHIKSPQAAFAVIQKGRELNIPPLYALSNIVVISGKPTANAELMQALIYRDHGDDALRFVQTTNKAAVLAYKRRGWPKHEQFTFSIEDATLAGLIKNGPWMQYPAAMLRARAISAVARLAFADSIGGLYTSEELGATVAVTSEGEVVLEAVPEERTNVTTGEMVRQALPPQLTPVAPVQMASEKAIANLMDVGGELQLLIGADQLSASFPELVNPDVLTMDEARTLYARIQHAIKAERERLAATPL